MILSTPARWLLRAAAAGVLTFIYVPLLLVLLNSFSTSVTFAWPPPGLTLRWWQVAASNEGVRTALLTSVEVALLATLIAVVLGTLASMALVRYEFFGRDAVSLLVVLPIALPGIVTGIALNTLFTQVLGGLTFFTLVVGHATFCIVDRGQQRLGAAAADVRARWRRRRWTSAPRRGRPGGSSPSRPCAVPSLPAPCWRSRCPSTRSSSRRSPRARACRRCRCGSSRTCSAPTRRRSSTSRPPCWS